MNDNVNHPAHYTMGKVECIDGIESALGKTGFLFHCRGTAIAYLWRAGHKGDIVEDLQKARWYIDKMIETMQGDDAL